MKKYAIDRSYGIFAHLRIPMPLFMLPAAQALMRPTHRVLRAERDVLSSVHSLGEGVRLFVIEPARAQGKLPCLIFLHGGAFAFPAYTYHYRLAARYAREIPCKVIFVDYRLLPKHRWPAQLDDSLRALQWVITQADTLRVDLRRLAVCGDSAGGQLAALTALRAAQFTPHPLSFQMLIYPALDDQMNTASMRQYPDTPLWNAVLNRKMWAWYLKGATTPYVSPLHADLKQSLPPAYVETAEFDCLRDEGIAYAKALEQAGAAVTLAETKGVMHGFELVQCKTTEAAIQKRLQFIHGIWK